MGQTAKANNMEMRTSKGHSGKEKKAVTLKEMDNQEKTPKFGVESNPKTVVSINMKPSKLPSNEQMAPNETRPSLTGLNELTQGERASNRKQQRNKRTLLFKTQLFGKNENRSKDRSKKKTRPSIRFSRSSSTSNGTAEKLKLFSRISSDEVGKLLRPIEDEAYYHGFMTKDEAEQLLRSSGQFLVRKANQGNRIHYAVSVWHNGDSHHILVRKTKKKRLYWMHKYAFKTVGEMVEYHMRNRYPIYGNIIISKPVCKKEWQLYHEQIEVSALLGAGAFGQVFKGQLQVSAFRARIPVAVKTLSNSTYLTEDERIQFLREANTMLKIRHINVVRFFGVAAQREPIMIVMEFCDGGSLESLLRKEQCTDEQKINFVYGAAKGMAYVETLKIIHRDIASRNCLLGVKNRVKISDFGLAAIGTEYKDRRMKNVPARWMAPETLKSGKYSSKSDVWSFSVLIWEVYMNGAEPYENHQDIKALVKLIKKSEIDLKFEKPIPSGMKELYRRCHAFEPADRPSFGEIRDVVAEMEGVEKEQPPSAVNKFWQRLTNRSNEYASARVS